MARTTTRYCLPSIYHQSNNNLCGILYTSNLSLWNSSLEQFILQKNQENIVFPCPIDISFSTHTYVFSEEFFFSNSEKERRTKKKNHFWPQNFCSSCSFKSKESDLVYQFFGGQKLQFYSKMTPPSILKAISDRWFLTRSEHAHL